MFGVIVNTIAVVVGSSVGLLLKKGIPDNMKDIIMKGIALCTIYIGITGSLKGQNALILILSIVIGAIIGQGVDLDKRLNHFASKLEKRFKKEGEKTSIAEGFTTASLLFCVGAMTIVGSLQAGLTGDNEMLFTKSMLDLISSCIFASALGIGVLFAAGFVFAFQGIIVVLAQYISPFLGDDVIAEMTCSGSLLIIALGLNIIGVTQFKVMNYLPAIFLPILLCNVMGYLPL
ncbi:DUF554 domain-containing protein [Clostridium aminobutyricum]|uniref:DUF554 domain-containing protein n=1 Tax=Clostridium aminobutyricum TaxID=33953 RepID=A0A939IG95_CLOAM|nr:DUF554 domain-containing protein [Clostridium aminobutyricum]MBN7772930.1 DUF554 domain-containing protein [Clostridium aminobutyricum]